MALPDLLPDPDVVIQMAPEELGRTLLQLAAEERGRFTESHIIGEEQLFGRGWGPEPGRRYYPADQRRAVLMAVREAWFWLQQNLLIMPDEGINGQNGYRILTRRGERLAAGGDWRSYLAAASFPKLLLHTKLQADVWLDLARGRYSTAVFEAFRAVEEAVRSAGGYLPEDVGRDLMNRAFNPDAGPLSKPTDPAAERQALQQMFAGAIGSYKNPHSHRTVDLESPREAQEMFMFASHLLHIVDSRVQRPGD